MQQARPDGHTLAQIPLGAFRLPYTTQITWDPVKDIALRLGIELNHIPYKGSADLMQSLLRGQLVAAADATGFAPHVASGKLRVLCTWGEQRLAKPT